MARLKKTGRMYLGRAGQMHAMAEFLERGYNVAVPEVDVGDDILVVRDDNGTYFRIQVKTATAKERKYGYSATFAIDHKALKTPTEPDTFYVLVCRLKDQWKDVIVVRQDMLYQEHKLHGVGIKNGKGLISFYVAFEAGDAKCSKRSWGRFKNNWSDWPRIAH